MYFNVPFELITIPDEEVVIFFQIMDNLQSHKTQLISSIKDQSVGSKKGTENNKELPNIEASRTNDTTRKSTIKKLFSRTPIEEWKTFAWAFLKVTSVNKRLNIGENMRLQLFYPRKHIDVELKELVSWWKSGARTKYPSTLFISLCHCKKTISCDNLEGESQANFKSSTKTAENKECIQDQEFEEETAEANWNRKPYSSCKVPNKIAKKFNIPSPGCLSLQFSPKGTKLACGASNVIYVFCVKRGKLLWVLEGHLGLIYDLSWTSSGRKLLSSSADCTARVWNLQSSKKFEIRESCSLVHPAYVYCAKWVPEVENRLITGCFDHIVRVWREIDGDFICQQELSEHFGFVNTMCFSTDTQLLYTGDQRGIICVWRIHDESQETFLSLKEDVKVDGVCGKIINFIDFHPNGHRLLVQTRDSQLRLVNHKVWKTTHVFHGPLNLTEQVRGCLSPCGNLVFAGGEDSTISSWNANSGQASKGLASVPFMGTISCLHYHPFDNILALSYFNSNPVDEVDPQSQSKTLSAAVLLLEYEDNNKNSIDPTNVPVSVIPFETKNNMNDFNDREDRKTWREVSQKLMDKLDIVLKMANENSVKLSNDT